MKRSSMTITIFWLSLTNIQGFSSLVYTFLIPCNISYYLAAGSYFVHKLINWPISCGSGQNTKFYKQLLNL